MTPDQEKAADMHIQSLFGKELELNPEVHRAMRLMYAFGRLDTLDYLGLDETDLPTGEDYVAWSA